jgi:hypothetical protein
MGKTKRSSKRNHTVAIHGTSAYPYSPKAVQPRSKPLPRTAYSASDLRRLFTSVKGPNGITKSRAGAASPSLAHRAASGLERLIARIMRSPAPGSGAHGRRGSGGGLSPDSSAARASYLSAVEGSSLEAWQMTASDNQLKRLGFVLAYADYYFNWGFGLAASVYSTGRALVPGPLAGVAGSLESTVTNISMPVINAVTDQSGRVLKGLDAKVDTVINAASGLYASNASALNKTKQNAVASSEKGLAACADAKDAYLHKIEDALALLKERGIGGAAALAADRVVATVGSVKAIPPYLETEAKALMLKVGDAWAKLAALPPVSLLVSTAQPSIDFAWTKYLDAHDAVVTAPSYNKAVDLGAEQLSKVQDSAVYKTYLKGVADPALDAIQQSGPYNALVDHLRPQLAGGAAAMGP